MELDRLGEVDLVAVGPDVEVVEAVIAIDDCGVDKWAAVGIGEAEEVGTGTEAADEGVQAPCTTRCVV